MTAERIRYYCDEHVDPDIAAALRRHGVDVTCSADAGLRSAADLTHWQYAKNEHRVIVTDDADFLRFAAASPDHAGIVVCQRRSRSIRDIIRGLVLIYELLTPEEMTARVEFL